MNTLASLVLSLAVAGLAAPARALQAVSLGSKGPLVDVKVMIKAGSAEDPKGKEGAAALMGELLTEGGFGDPKDPVTKDKLNEMTRPWGTEAKPRVSVDKEITVISATVPQERLSEYVSKILVPMLTKPLFDAKELERVRGEALQGLRSGLRFERIEDLGIAALDNLVDRGTGYAHPGATEKGLLAVTREDLASLHKAVLGKDNVVVGATSDAAGVAKALEAALPESSSVKASPVAPQPAKGRTLLIITQPNAISSGVHLGFPIDVTRKSADFWPLYVGNVWFGTHRDSFGHLYGVLREERGYNYGDYSYIEAFEGRPQNLFPPFNTPRLSQYFSMWARPVAHQYVPHVLKAMTFELDKFSKGTLTEEQCAAAKKKAKVLYLSLAETKERLVESKLDDAFYGLNPGYLDSYVNAIDAVTCEQVNAAIKKHLRADDVEYVVVTNESEGKKIADAVSSGAPEWGKEPGDYQIDVKDEGGKKVYIVPQTKLDLLRRDAAWAYYPLDIDAKDIKIVPAAKMFETADLPQ